MLGWIGLLKFRGGGDAAPPLPSFPTDLVTTDAVTAALSVTNGVVATMEATDDVVADLVATDDIK